MKLFLLKSCYLSLLAGLITVGSVETAIALEKPRPLPKYSARLLGSEQLMNVADYSSQVLLINTWATWCPPCRAEMPDFETIHQRYRNRGLVVVGVNIDEDLGDPEISRFVQGLGISFAIWRDPHNRFSKRFRTVAVPETFLVDRTGMIIHHWLGPLDPNAPENLALIQSALGVNDDAPAQNPGQSSPKRGKRLAQQRGCLNCHSIDGTHGVGPTWKGMSGRKVTLTDGRRMLRDRAYFNQAILNPDSDIVAGYTGKIMAGAMPGKPLNQADVDALISFFESLINQPTP